MLPTLVYLTLCRSIQLLAMVARGDAAKDLEILATNSLCYAARHRGPSSSPPTGR